MLDALQPGVVTGSQPGPPASHAAGACFRVLAPASGPWIGHEDDIAASVGGDWHFVSPREGMQIFDQAEGRWLVFRSHEWRGAEAPIVPIGGTVQDSEARTAIAALIEALHSVGILGPAAPLT